VSIVDLPLTAVTPLVTHDLYSSIHKAIRAELFAVTGNAGSVDPGQGVARAALASHVNDVLDLMDSHAEHEDGAIQPVLEAERPDLAERIAGDHHRFESLTADLREIAGEAASLGAPDPRARVHRLYLALASFTGTYLAHQDVEERVVMPALERAVGVDAVIAIHGAILGAIPPAEMAKTQAIMFPAMNLEDRVEMLGAIRQEAPPEAFAGVWSLARSVLDPSDAIDLAHRLGLG
jgi:hypothetical protein